MSETGLRTTLFLLVGCVAAGAAYREKPVHAATASPAAMAPATAQSAQKRVPAPKRHAAPPRRCSMVAYLVV